MRIKISDHGNVYSFEAPQGKEHISLPQPRTGILGESYVVCQGGVNASWDAGALEQGWGPPTIIQPNGPNTVPLTIIRTTTNGQLRLRQKFTNFPLRQELKIEMTFINLSASPLFVEFNRYVHFAVDGSESNLVFNTGCSIIARNYLQSFSSSNGLMLMGQAPGPPGCFYSFGEVASAIDYVGYDPSKTGSLARTCLNFPTSLSLMIRNWVGSLYYELGLIEPGINKTVSVTYKRIP
jgi:hypothetical protein